jgi:hypothetical protein
MASSSYFLCKVPFCRSTVAVLILGLWSGPVFAKAPELSAIELYPTADSQAYVQISGFALNAKNEVHLCSGAQTITKGSYGKLAKIGLAAGMSLERAKDGVLLLSRGGAPECVVPGNLKLEKEGETTSELAEKADLSGQIVATSVSGTASIPRLTPGVKIVLVAALDTELAEFLLAQRGGKIASWQAYLSKYPSGPHSGEAKAALSTLYTRDGQAALIAYQASLKDPQPSYAKLQAAKTALDSAIARAPSNPSTDALAKGIEEEAKALNSKGLGEITQYRTALANQTSGFSHLLDAEVLSQLTLNLEPRSPETLSLSQACTQERTVLDHRFVDFQNKLSASRPDEAYEAIKPLRPFAKEYPRVQTSLHALYTYHVEQAKKDADKSDLQGQVAELQKAAEAEPGPEITATLQAAQKQAQESTDKAAVTSARTMSTAAEDDKDYLKAYEVLDNLTPSQRTLVTDQLNALKDRYITAASAAARDLQRTHTPLRGLADEIGNQRAYNLLSRSYALTSDPSLQDRISIVAENLSAYYLTQAKHYLDRPDGTGANVGWNYLVEALQYKASNMGDVRAEMTRAMAAHQLKSKLSIKVLFRDQTSRSEATDFVEQLTDSLATGLETSSLDIVKVVRPKETPAVPPNFFLIGDVLQDTHANSIDRIAKSSKYGSGERDIITDEWSAANRDYDSAGIALTTAQASLQGAVARGKKGQISEETNKVAEATKKVLAARLKLDALPKTRSEQIERPYTYTEQINHLSATVELQFKIQDVTGSVIVPIVQIPETESKTDTTLEGVKNDDTMGIRVAGEVPSENRFLEKVQYDARDELLKQASARVAGLPALILQSADRKAAEADNDGAAEQYMLYLDSTASEPTPERRRAQKFLLDNYNFRAYGDPPKA